MHLPRSYLFAFDRTTGRVIATYVPALDGAVESIPAAPDGSSIIVAGRFKTLDGAKQRSLAMLDVNGARVPTFAAKTNGDVSKVLVRGSRMVAGGRFSTANGVARADLAVLDATTGALDAGFTIGVTQGRTKSSGATPGPVVQEMDADATGARLVVVGNFRLAGGLPRQQIAMIDLPTGTVSPWYTNHCPNDVAGTSQAWKCAQVFDTQMRDVDFSPDESYFVVMTTGGAPDRNVTSLCDTAARWETAGPAEELVAAAEGLYIGSDTSSLGGEYHARLGLFPVN